MFLPHIPPLIEPETLLSKVLGLLVFVLTVMLLKVKLVGASSLVVGEYVGARPRLTVEPFEEALERLK